MFEKQQSTERVDQAALMSHVSALCAHGERVAGSEEEGLACAYIVSQLKKWGVSCTVHRFRALISNPVDARLELVDMTGRVIRSIPGVGVAFSSSTPPEGLRADIVPIGPGREEDYKNQDVRDKIVLLDGLVSAMQGHIAKKHGAAGIIGVSQGFMLHKNTIGTVWGRPGFAQWNDIPRLPVICIGREAGTLLASLVREGRVCGVLHTVTEEEIRVLRLPVADVPGYKPEFVLAGAHYCSWFDGATDNATGNAVLLELARLFHAGKKTRFGLRLAWWPGHSQGRFSGSAWYAEQFRNELQKRCIGYFNIDSPGARGATACLPRYTMGEAMPFIEHCLRKAAPERAVSNQTERNILAGRRPDKYVCPTRPARQADQSFWGTGLTSFSVYGSLPPEHPDFRASVGGSGGAWWWHSKDDTVDKVDAAILGDDTRICHHLLRSLVCSPVLPWDYSVTMKDFSAALREYEEAAKGDVALPHDGCAELNKVLAGLSPDGVNDHSDAPDFMPLHQLIATLEKKAGALRARMDETAATLAIPLKTLNKRKNARLEREAEELNRRCLKLGRELIPILYMPLACVATLEQAPALASRLLPELAPALKLKHIPQNAPERFALYWSLSRGLESVREALTRAANVLDGL